MAAIGALYSKAGQSASAETVVSPVAAVASAPIAASPVHQKSGVKVDLANLKAFVESEDKWLQQSKI